MNTKNLMIIWAFIFVFLSFLIRFLGAYYTKNLALIMESMHIFIDVFITLSILTVIKIIYSKNSEKFPYGLFKLEDLISFLITLFIIYFAINFILTIKYKYNSSITISAYIELISLIPLAISSIFKIKASKILNSPSLKSDGIHTFADIIEGVFISLGLYLTNFYGPYSFYITIIIAFIALLITAYLTGKNAILSLLDLPHEHKLKSKMLELINNIKDIKNVKDIRFRWAGPVVFVEIIVEMDPKLTIDEAHPITEEIEKILKENIEGIYSVTVHVEPVKRKEFKVLIPLLNNDINSLVDNQLGRANYFAIYHIKDKEIEYEIKNNILINKENLIGPEFLKFLENEKITDVICKNVGEIIYGLLTSHNIYCWKFEGQYANDAIKLFLDNKIKKYKL
ncbi:MAG: cation diffusion facilitator family transporter [Thermoplasmata archaeon]|jgi:cation diffusion facilitator family transporter